MKYTIYKITNKINNKIYIGKHQTNNLDDGYMGSGKHLSRAKSKYGLENFSKEYLFVFDNEDEMNDKEAELVTKDFCLREDTYNICPGGKGGWGYVNSNPKLFLTGKRLDSLINVPIEIRSSNGKKTGSDNFKSAHKAGKIRYDTFSGRKHKTVSKEKIRIANSITQAGERNSQYGTCWINDGISKPIKIKKSDLDKYLKLGYNRGRKN